MFSKALIKYIQSLQTKKIRDSEGVFIAEGPKLVEELFLQKIFKLQHIYCLAEWANLHVKKLSLSDENYTVIEDFELKKISALSTPNQVLALFEKAKNEPAEKYEGLILMLDDIRDPGNMGTIIRSCDWFGVKHIICSENCVDIYNTKVVQSTMASLGRPRIFFTNLVKFLKDNSQLPVYAASLEGEQLGNVKVAKDIILIIGNEANGISTELMDLATKHITIKKRGEAESLNAAIATSIFLFALTDAI
ncbi:MAG: RNA methyltransferase [Ferruginibacter sp.]